MTENILDYETFCGVCGFPIKTYQIGTVLDDLTVMDFNERCYVDFSAHICNECWEKMKSNTNGGLEKAMAKKNLLGHLQGKLK